MCVYHSDNKLFKYECISFQKGTIGLRFETGRSQFIDKKERKQAFSRPGLNCQMFDRTRSASLSTDERNQERVLRANSKRRRGYTEKRNVSPGDFSPLSAPPPAPLPKSWYFFIHTLLFVVFRFYSSASSLDRPPTVSVLYSMFSIVRLL